MNETKKMNSQEGRIKGKNPYKGLESYQEADKDHFFGRQEETDNLLQRVKQDRLTVVIGKSGIGKTSLLNAGLFPALGDENFFPIRVRLNYSPEALPLLLQVHKTILDELQNRSIKINSQADDKPASPLTADETLWEYFRRVNHFVSLEEKEKRETKTITPVLVFDQFEELFAKGGQIEGKDNDNLINELYWLVEDQIPYHLRGRHEDSKGEASKIKKLLFSQARPDIRVIISLREDYLPHLLNLKSRIHSIDQTLFRVTHLNGIQAREIINMPGGIRSKKVTGQILEMFVAGNKNKGRKIEEERLVVDPWLLSVICFKIAYEGVKSFAKKDRERILSDLYESAIKEFPEKVNRFIEDKLVDQGGNRTLALLSPGIPLEQPLLQLVEKRILRKSPIGTRNYIEVVHDVLALIIRARRDKRYRNRIVKKKIKRFFYRITLAFVIFGIIISLIFALYTRKQYKNALVNRLTAEALLESSIDNTKSLRIAEAAYKRGLPQPPLRTIQALGEIAYSSIEKPFYSLTTPRQKGPIYSALFSPGGDKILTAGEDKIARIWDLKGKLLAELKGHTGRIMSAAYSPDGTYIVTGSWDKTARIWHSNGNLQKELIHEGIVNRVTLSHDSKQFLIATRNGMVKLWDIRGNSQPVNIKHDSSISSALFSPDDKMILTSSWDKTAKLWNNEEKELITFAHEDSVSSAIFSPDGRFVLTASWDKRARLWGIDGNLQKEFKHDDAVNSAVFSGNGKQILTASRDGRARIWNLVDGKLLMMIKHGSPLISASFSPDEQKIIAISKDGQVGIWDNKGRLLVYLSDKEERIRCATFSQDSSRLLTGADNGIARVWDLDERILVNLQEPAGDIKIAQFTPHGNQILTAASDMSIRLQDIEGNVLVDLKKHRIPISSASFTTDGSRILTFAGAEGTVKVQDAKVELLLNLKRKNSRIMSAELSPSGCQVLEVSDGTAGLWSIIENSFKGKLIRRLTAGAAVSLAIFSPAGSRILAALADNTLILWDLSGNIIANLTGHQQPIASMEFSPNGRRILTASADNTARLWTTGGKEITVLRHQGAVFSAQFAMDGSRILTVGQDNAVKVWDSKGRILLDLKYDSPVLCAAFSPDAQLVTTGSKDGNAILWNMEGKLLFSLKHEGAVLSVVFSNDGSQVLSMSSSGTAKLWLTPNAIYRWLKKAGIPKLSPEEKEKLGID
ncbi:MAG: AAA family ATPase [Candidatus Aminicenantes bacterium]|nr:AAA family ATPase [Candidatus Aminicenantes bacterium]